MPYTVGSKDLPSHVKKVSSDLRRKWVSIFNAVYKEKGESIAFRTANSWLKKQLESKKKEMVAKSNQFRRVTFELDKSGEFVKKSDNGDYYVSFMLTDIFKDNHGDSYDPQLLQRWADEINSGNTLVGDVNHEEYDRILASHADSEIIESMLKNKKGIAKAVKAVFEKGKLWVKALIDKRYKKVVEKADGVSLEAFIENARDNIAQAGKLLGFTFMVGDEPANPRARITK